MNINKKYTLLVLVLMIGLVISACGAEETPPPVREEGLSPNYVIAEGRVLPLRSTWLNVAVPGRVSEILFEEGDQVSKGQDLIRLADSEAAGAALLAAELELIRAQQDLDDFLRTADLALARSWQAYQAAQSLRGEAEEAWEDLDLDYLEDRVDEARIEVRDRESDLDDAQEDWAKYQDVDDTNFARQAAEDDLENAREDLSQAQRDLEEALFKIEGVRADLDAALAAEKEARREYELRLEDGFDRDQKALLETRLAAAEASLAAAQNTLENFTLRAPFAGTLTDIYLEPGQFVGPERTAVQLADLSAFKIETSDLTELEVVKIYVGQAVEIVPDALPEVLLSGVVEKISHSVTPQAGDILYTVSIRLDEIHPDLRWGMTLELSFLPE